jgi:3-oxoacyl-[acyl-carrier-protein] synthase II
MSGDAHHMTAPPPDGDGAHRAMRAAVKNAKISPEQIGYINAHGTSTLPGDTAEIRAIYKLFENYNYKNLCVSSTKSSTGHLLGGAGAIEAVFSIQAMRDGVLPPTLNLEDPDDGCDIDLIPLKARKREIEFVMSNSFGFGGTNASLIFKKV